MPRILALTCLLLLSVVARAGGLFDAGAWAPIVLPAEPELDELHAARTLADWCERVTGVRPETRYEAKGVRQPAAAIYVGKTAAARSAGIRVAGEEGDVARRAVVGQSVFLLGNNPAATRIAAGRFCEQHLGVFFAFPGELGADWRPRYQLGFPAADEFRPDFRWRQLSGLNELSEDWAFSVGYGRAPGFSHGLYRAFDQKLWKQEPMLFPMVSGKATEPKGDAHDPNPHLDNPRAPEVGAQYARAFFRQHPDAFSVPLGVNDTLKFDDSAESEGWYRERPVRTDYVFSFYNAVADSAWAPEGDPKGERHAIGALAYLQTLRAPTIRLRPAIFPWVCADRTAYADPAFAAQDRANLAAWAKSGVRRLGVYDYLYGAEVASPRVNLTALIQSVHAAYSAGARGWYAEAYPLWAFDAPKLWVAAKLLENRMADTVALRRTWFERAYGPAADEMIAAYAQIEAAWKRDALSGGKDQFLRHFHDQRGALVLSAGEIAAISQRLLAAQQILRDPTSDAAARRRQAWRLGQFAEAWDLYLGYRELVQARRVIPSAEARLAALRRLTAADAAYAAKEAAFNRRWGAYGQPVRWQLFPGENPRAQWSERYLVEGAEASLARWAAADQPKGWLAYRVAQQAETAPVAHRHDFAEAETPTDLAPSAYNRQEVLRSGLRLVAPSGKIGPVVAPVALKGGQLVRLQLWTWTDELPVAEQQLVVTLRFTGPNARAEVKQVCQSRQTIVPAVVPAWATGLEYELGFTGGAFPQEASVQLIDLPAAAVR
ncbi:MAG: DUF4838 domain-containing protein [Verrucomicrobia bacterium]|nr:DUF4838 domain-containing protein [Verrucomicrobiota bacterium]